jgi:hydrogenase maturation protease
MSIVVLGVGNILLSDEAIGVRVIENLQQNYHFPAEIELVDGGTAGMELLEFMANKEHVIIVDAVLTGGEPGEHIILKDEKVPTFFNNKISPHQLGLSDLLSALKFTGESPAHVTLIGAVPESVEPGVQMTARITKLLPQLTQQVIGELAAIGINAKRKVSQCV